MGYRKSGSVPWVVISRIGFIGFGKFTSLTNRSEVFLACDGASVSADLYCIDIKHLGSIITTSHHRITLQPSPPVPRTPAQRQLDLHKSFTEAREVIKCAQGEYFAWLGDPSAISIWSVELGSMISFIPSSNLSSATGNIAGVQTAQSTTQKQSSKRIITRIAPRGRYMAVADNGQIRQYLLPSGTLVGVIDITKELGQEITVTDILWDGGGLFVVYQDETVRTTFLAALNVEAQHWGERRVLPSSLMEHRMTVLQKIYTAHGPTLDISSVDDLVKVPSSEQCSDDCRHGVAGLSMKDISLIQEHLTEDRRKFQFGAGDSLGRVNLLLLSPQGVQLRQWHFLTTGWQTPANDENTGSTSDSSDGNNNNDDNDDINNSNDRSPTFPVSFLDGTSLFLVPGAGHIQVWRLLEDELEPCKLIAVMTDPTASSIQRASRPVTCKHMRYLTVDYGEGRSETIDMLTDLNDRLVCMPNLFTRRVFPTLVQLYTAMACDDVYRQALLQYTSQMYAQCSTWGWPKTLFLWMLCKEWETEGFDSFLQDLVQYPDFVWIPTSYTDASHNAIASGINTAREYPHRNIQFHRTLIRHCIQNATKGGDTFFLKPILDCMPLILEDGKLGQEVTRQMAFIPVPESSRTFAIENSVLSHNPFGSWLPFMRKRRTIYNEKNPILILQCAQPPDPQIKHLKKRLYVAPLAMLYGLKTNHGEQWRKNIRLIPHKFTPKIFDNPALEALLLYAWNQKGARRWLYLTIGWGVISYLVLALQCVPGLLGVVLPKDAQSNPPHLYDSKNYTRMATFLIYIGIFIAFPSLVAQLRFQLRCVISQFKGIKVRRNIIANIISLMPFTLVVGFLTKSIAVVGLAHLLLHFHFVSTHFPSLQGQCTELNLNAILLSIVVQVSSNPTLLQVPRFHSPIG
ncbi:hypothetical protein EDD21DRAFT_158937 [Dissophora ornata]|nr:hypothetical protein EDD21DRAFT_158937 [Dissophora ornata]